MKPMTVRAIQYLIGSVFLILGGWCLVLPQSVIDLTIQPEFHSQDYIVTFMVACFGAQAVLFGIVAFTATFTRRTFLALGLALIPFLVFNYYFYIVVPVLSFVGLIDLVGNLTMLGLCYLGYRKAPA